MDLDFKDWREGWKTAWDNSHFKFYFLSILIVFVIVILMYGRFLDYIELRPGSVLVDPVLNRFIPIEVTWFTFGIIYLSVIVVLIHLSWQPIQLLIAFQAYILIAFARMLSMYLTPLDPPPLLIPLEDPFVQSVSSSVLTRDLFFSGHTSTAFLLYLSSTGRKMKIFFLICTILIGLLVLVQHVHYTIDVIAAPFYAYTCYKISSYLSSKFLLTTKNAK
jgi:hypothetical protein